MNILAESRLALEIGALLRHDVWRGSDTAQGQGEPVLLIPGLMLSDATLQPMASWLRRIGYRPAQTGIRTNVSCSEDTLARILPRLKRSAEVQQGPVALIGQSRGGMLARVLAVRHPELVSTVITLGSPLGGTMEDLHWFMRSNISALSRVGNLHPTLLGHSCWSGAPGQPVNGAGDPTCCEQFWPDMAAPLPDGIRGVSVFSRSDGIIAPAATESLGMESVEVHGTHIGMGVNREVFAVIADELEAAREAEAGGVRRKLPRRPSRRRHTGDPARDHDRRAPDASK